MRRHTSWAWVGFLGLVAGPVVGLAGPRDGDETPAELAPFEHLVGAWKGAGIPTANRVKGWTEKHSWAWLFSDGRPVGLSVSMADDKTLAKATLTFDADKGRYRLEGTDPDGKPAAFVGKLDDAKQVLTLDRVGALPGGAKQRLTLRLNSNGIRYVIWDDRQQPGAPRFARFIEVNQGKEGEAFAAGAGGSNLPKCVLTGGAATMSVSYKGRSYPVCCTGCRDEFEADPEKYVKKAEARAQAEAAKGGGPAPDSVGKDDGSFDSLLGDSGSEGTPRKKARPKGRPESEPTKPEGDGRSKPSASKAGDPGPAKGKAADLLARAQALEKQGKAQAAIVYYRILVKDHPRSPQAKSASERLKALGEK